MKNILIGVLICFSAFFAKKSYDWKQVADERGWKAEEAYRKVLTLEKDQGKGPAAWIYLAQPVLSAEGKKLSRADLLDMLLAKAIKP